jgi:hypothetical protein
MNNYKEKAEELYNKFLRKIEHNDAYWDVENDAKQCALICVDEILNIYEKASKHPQTIYWQQVKTEIEKL